MGLNLFLADYDQDPSPEGGGSVDGMREYFFEVLRELSDVAEPQKHLQGTEFAYSLRIPDERIQWAYNEIKENVPLDRLNSFGHAINAYASQAHAELRRMNGHATMTERNILEVSLQLSTTVKVLLEAVVLGEDPLEKIGTSGAAHDAALLDIVDEDAPLPTEDGESVVARDEEDVSSVVEKGGEDDEPEFAIPELAEWRHHNGDDDEEEEVHDGKCEALSWEGVSNPDDGFEGYTGDAETEELISIEAETALVDMQRITDEFNHLQMVVSDELESAGMRSLSPEYDLRLCNVMNMVNKASGGKITIEVLVSILFDEEIIEQLEALDMEERKTCIHEVFRTVAVEALMQVQVFSDMCDAKMLSSGDEDDDEQNDGIDELTDYYVGQLMKRQGIL